MVTLKEKLSLTCDGQIIDRSVNDSSSAETVCGDKNSRRVKIPITRVICPSIVTTNLRKQKRHHIFYLKIYSIVAIYYFKEKKEKKKLWIDWYWFNPIWAVTNHCRIAIDSMNI